MADLWRFSKEYEEENLNAGNRKRHLHWKGLLLLILTLLLGALLVGSYLIRIETVTVTGNQAMSDQLVIDKVFPTENGKRLGIVLYDMVFGLKTDDTMTSVSLKLTSLQSCEIEVKESEPVAQVHCGDWYVLLNKSAVVMGVEATQDPELCCLEGNLFSAFTKFEVPETSDMKGLLEAVLVAKTVRYAGFPGRTLEVLNRTYTLDDGDIRISLGTAENMEAKLLEASMQLPSLSGLKGTLHLESYAQDSENTHYYFTVETD